MPVCCLLRCLFFFFFKQKTAYEMRISDWSSDVCSSDLTLARGFTTVRDLGGDVEGLRRAIAAGLVAGPHIVRAGRMLTQTGGHGDAESGPRPVPTCACEMRHTAFGIVADGADAVRKAARHNLRDRSEEHTSELQSIMRISYAVLWLEKKTHRHNN